MSREIKDFIQVSTYNVSHNEYLKEPASTFLQYATTAKNANLQCEKKLSKNGKAKEFNVSQKKNLDNISSSLFLSIMSHFETYERYLFSGLFDLSAYFVEFDIDEYAKKTKATIDLSVAWAHRGVEEASVGLLVANSFLGWHNPTSVNTYFCNLVSTNLFSSDDIKTLNILWQLRHSLIHTGGTISYADAQKIEELRDFAGKHIKFDKTYIQEIVRRFHPLVYDATMRIKSKVDNIIKPDAPTSILEKKDLLFSVNSPTSSWFSVENSEE